jgi:hypothetical protein
MLSPLAALKKELERSVIDKGAGIIEDIGKGVRIYLYEKRGLGDIPGQNSGVNSDRSTIDNATEPDQPDAQPKANQEKKPATPSDSNV